MKEGTAKRLRVLIFRGSDKVPEYYYRTCKECMFFAEIPHHNYTQKYCLLHQRVVSKKNTACSKFEEKQKEHYKVINEFPEKCVVCGFALGEYVAVCPNCGTVYIPRKNSKYLVVTRNFHEIKKLLDNNAAKIHFDPPHAVKHHFSLTVQQGDIVKLRGQYIYVRHANQKRGQLWAPQLLKSLVIKGNMKISGRLFGLLTTYNVPIYQFSKYSRIRESKAQQLKQVLEHLRYDTTVTRDYTAKVIAELLSDIVLMRNVSATTRVPTEPYIKTTLNLIISMLFQYPDLRSVDALAYEGSGKAVTWNYLRHALGNLIPPRVTSRFIPYYYTAAKSPFHAVYNYMIRKLVRKTRELMQAAGFSYYEAGPGMLHRRNTKYFIKSEGLLFDVIDMFRAPFLLEAVLFLLKYKEIVKFFERFRNSTVGYAYAVDRISSFLLNDIFIEVMEEKMVATPRGNKSVYNALKDAVLELPRWLSDHKAYAFPLFLYIPTKDDLQFLADLTEPLNIAFYNVKPWVRILNALSMMNKVFGKG